MAKKYDVTVLGTKDTTSYIVSSLITYLKSSLAPRVTRHGVLVEIYGEGILINGDSGIGKSETAIELVKRGHRLIADDAVEIKKVSPHELVGSAPPVLKHYIELRGIGVINVAKLFGMGAVKESSNIDLIFNMVPWRDGEAYDRLGMETQYTEILDVKVPSITVPITPGRNLAVIFEVAAMNNRQKGMGYNAAQKLADAPDLLSDWLEGNLRPSHADLAEASGIPFLAPFHAETPDEAALWMLTAEETGSDPARLFRLYGIDPASLSRTIGTDYLQLTASKAPTLSEVVAPLAAEDAMSAVPERAEAERFLHAVPYALLENRPDDFLTLLPEDMPLAKSKNYRKRFRRDFRRIRDRVENVLRAVAEENARRKESFAEGEAPASDSGDAAKAAKARFVSLLGYPDGFLLSVRLQTTIDAGGADLRRKPVERLFARSRIRLTNAEFEALEREVTPAREAAALLALTNAETEAMTRDIESRRAVESADLVIVVADGSHTPLTVEPDILALAARAPHWILAISKDDRNPAVKTAVWRLPDGAPAPEHLVSFNSVMPGGLDALIDTIGDCFPAGVPAGGTLLTNARQAEAIRRALESVRAAREALTAGLTPDVVLTEAEGALDALGELTGRTAREDMVTRIFERFCVGK